jgi:polysaccharide pyruvyl transferase WcaK-like protein
MQIPTHSAPPKVGLAGFYGHGNFGDDLMAVIIGLFLKQAGIPFSVYKLCPPYAEAFQFTVAHSAGELLQDTQVLLWGGGGLLAPWSNLTYNLLFPGVAEEFDGLIKAARCRGLRLCACSVGGNGDYPARLTPDYKQSFVEAAEYISVRNPHDLALLERVGVRGDYFPDIVWRAPNCFPVRRRKSGAPRVGIDLYMGNLARTNSSYIIPLLYFITRSRRDCEFVFMDTTNRSVRPYRGLGGFITGANVSSYQFHDPFADLEFLASLDLLVSSRLHTVVLCLGYGVPAVSLFGEKKTRLLLENLGRPNLYYGHRRIRQFLSLMLERPAMAQFIREFEFPDVARLSDDSSGHLRRLLQVLQPGAETARRSMHF